MHRNGARSRVRILEAFQAGRAGDVRCLRAGQRIGAGGRRVGVVLARTLRLLRHELGTERGDLACVLRVRADQPYPIHAPSLPAGERVRGVPGRRPRRSRRDTPRAWWPAVGARLAAPASCG